MRLYMETENNPVAETEKKCCREERAVGKDALLIAGAVVLGSLIVAGAVFTLSPKAAVAPTKDTGSAAQVPAGSDNPADTKATTSISNSAVLGDKTKVKVAIVEFSDYECPFCKSFHQTTFDQLKKEFVDTGKAIIVFRNFPLSFHEPNATLEAATAECVRKEKGDVAYFAFGKALYQNTQANGKGLVAGKLDELIRNAGANPKTVNVCAASDAVKQEIVKDTADGGKAGVQGTPSFVIGTLDGNGTVTGERVVGAVPFDTFKTTVEKYLK